MKKAITLRNYVGKHNKSMMMCCMVMRRLIGTGGLPM